MSIFVGVSERTTQEHKIASKNKRKKLRKAEILPIVSSGQRRVIHRLPTPRSYTPLNSQSNEQGDPLEDDPLFLLTKIRRDHKEVRQAQGIIINTYAEAAAKYSRGSGNGNIYKYQLEERPGGPGAVHDTLAINFVIAFGFILYTILLFCCFKYKMSVLRRKC